MDETYCSDCKQNTVVVSDHTTGDMICSECRLVLESHLIDETSEWRIFADESGDRDPVRVGAPTNPLLAGGGLYTVITTTKPNGVKSNGATNDALRWNRGSSNPDRALGSAFETIGTMCDKLSLVETIKYRASEIYKNVKDQKSCRGRNHDSILAACLFIACRQEDKPRTFKEICTVVNGAKMKDIRKALKFIVKQVEGSQSVEIGTVDAGDFINRFCSKLCMKFQTNKAAHEAFEKSKEFDIRRSPLSIAAAVIYIVTQLSHDKRSLKDVSTVTEVAQGTIRSSCKDLYPHLVKIIPSWYARQDDLKNVCAS